MLSDTLILRKIRQQAKQVAGYKQLVRELGLHGEERRELSERLEKLVSAGTLVEIDRDRYGIPQLASGKNQISGRLNLHRDGFGFVIPDLSGGHAKLRVSGDIFIAPRAIGSAMHGDRVLVEVTSIRSDGRSEGRIVRTLERAHPTLVGLFHYGSRYNYVTPLDLPPIPAVGSRSQQECERGSGVARSSSRQGGARSRPVARSRKRRGRRSHHRLAER